MIAGTVSELWRFPVKSMAGEHVEALRCDGRGAAGDRTHALRHEHRGRTRLLTAREAPRLLAWRAAYPEAPGEDLAPEAPPPACLTDPTGRTWGWGDAGLPARLSADLGRTVVPHRDLDGQQDLDRSLLVTVEATRRGLEDELAAPIDLRRFRPNVHLALDVPAWSELAWEGGRMVFAGGLELRLLHPCRRCAIPTRDPDTQAKWAGLLRHLSASHALSFGINARVERAGTVARGEPVSVQPPPG